ncbi:HipA domain-containing protein [Mitsuaria sp. GD03876]|uniref:HipA domain-containing protein n=1 Tax=Mitsuaria sp. GD03876 TaxID=2975399 RepID=UPI00244C5595|nr:HipA domain-containing protein [Mitsuaria sp. GD03876]MDH0865267.1 HipA domain-containing protein [Mitsuaria sp. GD03876]
MTGLAVWLDEHEVGWLKPAGGGGAASRLSLGYLERWTSEVLAFPLAPPLPLPARGGPGSEREDEAAGRFFERLLPDGDARRRSAAALGLAPDDVFGALRHMGRDAAGAVRLIDEDRPRPAGPAQRLVTREELSERLRHRDAAPFAVWDGQVRGVLAGERDKLGVYVEPDGGWYLVDGPQMASTHVLKPAPASPARRDQPFDEYFCMRLAARVGLDVAAVQLHCVPEPVLLVARFDRQRLEDGRVRRLHAIDARQALGKPPRRASGHAPEQAEEQAPGASDVTDAERFALIKHSPTPLIDGRALLRWTVFRQLIGSDAAAADNLCFFVDHGGLRLAPAFGLASGPADGPAGGPAGGDGVIDDWAGFARDCDLAPRSLALELRRMSDLVPAQARALADELSGEVPRAVVERLLDTVDEKARRMAGFAVRG